MKPDVEPPKEDKNLARNIRLAFATLSGKVLNARPTSFAAVLALRDLLHDQIRGSDLTVTERQERLFTFDPEDPLPWDKLAMAVLDSRCLPLPESMMPASQAGLLELCKNLLDRTDDFHIRVHFVAGWDGDAKDSGEAALKAFCHQLWHTRVNDGEFYRAVVSGMHGTAVSYLTHKRIPLGHTPESAIRLIHRMAMIWCAHDVLATAARARRSMRKPLGWLLAGMGTRMRAGTVLAICRPVYKMLVVITGRYRTNEEIRGGKKEARPSRHDDVKTVKAEVELRLVDRSARSVSKRRERDGLSQVRRNSGRSVLDRAAQIKDLAGDREPSNQPALVQWIDAAADDCGLGHSPHPDGGHPRKQDRRHAQVSGRRGNDIPAAASLPQGGFAG